jgi:UDP-glucose 4-epimerase
MLGFAPTEEVHSSGAKQAYKAVGESSEIPVTYYHNNVTATIYLLQIMSEFDCTRLVYSSSATVYGTPPVVPIPETTRLEASSPYGQSKIMCESIIQDLIQGMHSFLCHVDAAELAQRNRGGTPSP